MLIAQRSTNIFPKNEGWGVYCSFSTQRQSKKNIIVSEKISPRLTWEAVGQWWRLFCGPRQKEIKTELRSLGSRSLLYYRRLIGFAAWGGVMGKLRRAKGQTAGAEPRPEVMDGQRGGDGATGERSAGRSREEYHSSYLTTLFK